MKKLIKITPPWRGKQRNRGMTYVELIVVLSIFATMSSVVMFNYGTFQAQVDIKNLASDIALKIVEAQKSSLSGKLPLQTPTIDPSVWKPSYGVYFNINSAATGDSKSFIYFTDLDNDNWFDDSDCVGECLDKITIPKDIHISGIYKCVGVDCASSKVSIADYPLSITFKRPDSRAIFYSNGSQISTGFDYVQIEIKAPQSTAVKIKIYHSGRIQVN